MNRAWGFSALVACVGLSQLMTAQVSPLTNFGMVGVTRAQTLQINLVAFPPDPCSATMGFQDKNGNAVGTTKSVTLQGGQSASLAIKGSTLTSVKDQLVEVLPKIVLNGNMTSCVASAEVFTNSSGITNVLVAGAVSYPPDPVFGQLGVTSVQTVRLNVVAFPPSPCDGTLSFLNSNGLVVGSTLGVQLLAGQAASLDLPGTVVVTQSGQRAEVQPTVAVSGGSSCIASAEVFNNTTEIQVAFFPPSPCAPSSTSCVTF
jgi:hypothetical protein